MEEIPYTIKFFMLTSCKLIGDRHSKRKNINKPSQSYLQNRSEVILNTSFSKVQ